jgi:hypothetical protein
MQILILKIDNSNLRDDFGREGFPIGMRGAVLLLRTTSFKN